MKTSVTNMMMSLALMGCLIFNASDAMAQGRSRSHGGSTTSRSQSAAVSRSDNHSTAPTVSRNSSSSSVSRSSSATPSSSVSRNSSMSHSSSTSSSSSVSRSNSMSHSSSATPQVNRGTSSRPTTSGTTTRNGGDINKSKSKSGDIRPVDKSKSIATDRSSSKGGTMGTRPSTSGNNDHKPDGNMGNDRNRGGDKDRNGNMGNDRNRGGSKDRNGNMGNDRNRPDGNKNGGKRPGGNGGHNGDRSGFGSHNHFNYSGHHYYNDFHRNHINHSWSWSRPLPPPARRYRPTLLDWYRPVIPYGWHPYTGAPIIDRILGLTFGTLFDASIDYLYYNGYEIDGYADHVIYLRNVSLINHLWEDVMLCYDDYDRLVNAQFIYHSSTNDRYRYDRIYNSLCRVYGTPITNDSRGISWYGGGSNGWVTLSTYTNLGHYYTTLSIGY